MPFSLGAYRVLGAYGDHRAACRGVFREAYTGPGTDGGDTSVGLTQRATNYRDVLKRLVNKGYRPTVDLERHRTLDGTEEILLPVGQALKAARPVWGSVERLCLADEAPALDYNAIASQVRRKIAALGLQARPLGAVFTAPQILAGDAALWGPLDWIGVEGYTNVIPEPQPAKAVRKKLEDCAAKIGPGYEIVTIAQAFTRNGTFILPQQILGVNKAAVEFAQARGGALLAFRYGQAGGIKDLPFLMDYYREVARG